jgi:hypothetical protein
LADADGLAEAVFGFKVVCCVVFLSGHVRVSHVKRSAFAEKLRRSRGTLRMEIRRAS